MKFTTKRALSLLLAVATIGPAIAGPPIRPNPTLTPGAVFKVTREALCVPGYARSVREVSEETKQRVFREYGIVHPARGEYEIDHLVSLELGGSNSIRNLWPESYLTPVWNAHTKDRLEDKLHELVCSGRLDLATAQREEASDWISAYKRYVGAAPVAGRTRRSRTGRHRTRTAPATRQRSSPVRSSGADPLVWVNTRTNVFHMPGSRWYGKTAEGKYIHEDQALREGDREAENGQ